MNKSTISKYLENYMHQFLFKYLKINEIFLIESTPKAADL